LNYKTRYHDWLISDSFDEETRSELEEIANNEEEIEDRFYKDLDFGTGGMRGKIGAGTNRINKYTIRKSTQGLANYIINYSDDGREKGIVIAYDSRHKSREFASEAALVLCGNNIKTYLFDSLRPTPELSFAVRELGTIGGIVITASHNPPEYNGYKVYWEDGGQVVPERAREIIAEIEEIDDQSLVKIVDEDEACDKELLVTIAKNIDDRYMEEMLKIIPDKDLIAKKGSEVKILYTPLHGTGNIPVRRLLKELGFSDVKVVEEQEKADPDFPTISKPNPGEAEAYKLALEVTKDYDADLIMATDPDCDRMGVIIKDDSGEYIRLNGNEIGILLADYILENIEIPKNAVIIKTIVSTEMAKKLAEKYGVELQNVLTGFKFIGEKIKDFEEKGDRKFIFGFEESYGYLAGTYARDKDATIASGLFAAMLLHRREQGKTVYRRLMELREEFAYYLEDLESIRLEGKEGQEIIATTLDRLREDRLMEINNSRVVIIKDYLEGKTYNILKDNEEDITLPESNVLQFYMEDESLLTIRPSGTEPKLKLYFSVCGNDREDSDNKLEHLKRDVLERINNIIDELK